MSPSSNTSWTPHGARMAPDAFGATSPCGLEGEGGYHLNPPGRQRPLKGGAPNLERCGGGPLEGRSRSSRTNSTPTGRLRGTATRRPATWVQVPCHMYRLFSAGRTLRSSFNSRESQLRSFCLLRSPSNGPKLPPPWYPGASANAFVSDGPWS